MFTFVKSFFIAPAEAEDDDSGSSSSVEEIENKASSPLKQRNETVETSAESTEIADKEKDTDSLQGLLWCQLFGVDGLDFECLLERGYIIVEDGEVQILRLLGPGPSDEDEVVASWKISKILLLRQHQDQSFQLMIGSGRDNAQEYGIMFTSLDSAREFRRLLWPELLKTAAPLVSLSCAIASYDHKDKKEFELLSTNASAKLHHRSTDGESFFSFSDPLNEEIFVAGNVTMEIQPAAARQENKLSFMAIPFNALGNSSTLYLVEFLPSRVGEKTIDSFFVYLARLLRDRNFAETKPLKTSVADTIDLDDSMSDESFDLGDLGDEKVRSTWRNGTMKGVSAEGDDGSSRSESDDESEASELPQRYKSRSSGGPTLSHRFMDVGTDRTFVCRDDQAEATPFGRRKGQGNSNLKLSVYKRSQGPEGDEVLTAAGTVSGEKFCYKQQTFTPTRGILHGNERQLVVSAPEEHGLYLMDLATEQVVQKFETDGHAANSIFAAQKFGGKTHDPTFLASNPRSLYMMDSRTNNRGMAYDYATNPQLTTGSTDAKGHIAIASRLGELRLFDGQVNTRGDGMKRAKTLLTTVKEPITAVDVTKDGSWLVATTRTFLIVFCTKLRDTGRTGFEAALGQHKPAARYLMLTAEDLVKYEITDINFAPAHFDQDEECIVTSTGNMAVVWDFGTVKRGKPFYSVRFAPDSIRDVQVSMEHNNVVVAYPSAVALMATEKRERNY